MKRYSEQEIHKVKELRKSNAYSFSQLSQIFGIPSTTIRNWCFEDNHLTKWDTLRATNERRRQEFKQAELSSLSSITTIDTSTAKVLAALIYWCEGAKYPATNKMALANSDVDLLTTFIKLLRLGFSIDESKFRVHLQVHNTQNLEKIKYFWSNQLDIPLSQFIQPTITSAHGKKHRKTYMGTCTLRYNDYSLQLNLIGLYEAFSKKI